MGKSKMEILAGVDGVVVKSRKVANNTIEYFEEDGTKHIRLHNTNIVTFSPNGDIVLNSGGWLTVTTKERINRYLPKGFYLFQEDRNWFLSKDTGPAKENEIFAYQDGITIHSDLTVTGYSEFNPKANRKLKRDIKSYIDGFMLSLKTRNIPKPDNGDCWGCLMRDKEGKTVFGNDHIFSHLEEKYYVPSLLINAVETIPVSNAAKHCLGYWLGYHEQKAEMWEGIAEEQIKSSLRRYISEQVGMAR